jgi:hypothetical protein
MIAAQTTVQDSFEMAAVDKDLLIKNFIKIKDC